MCVHFYLHFTDVNKGYDIAVILIQTVIFSVL